MTGYLCGMCPRQAHTSCVAWEGKIGEEDFIPIPPKVTCKAETCGYAHPTIPMPDWIQKLRELSCWATSEAERANK